MPKDGVCCPNFQWRFPYSRKNCTKPNPNRIAVQLNLWKLCISAKSQKQLVLQSLNFHIWHRVLIHIGKFGDSFNFGLFSAFRCGFKQMQNWICQLSVTLNEDILITMANETPQKKDSKLLHLYSMANCVASWLKWLQMILNDHYKWLFICLIN